MWKRAWNRIPKRFRTSFSASSSSPVISCPKTHTRPSSGVTAPIYLPLKGGGHGDLFVKVAVMLPEDRDDDLAALMRARRAS